jgi:hypothetical protein
MFSTNLAKTFLGAILSMIKNKSSNWAVAIHKELLKSNSAQNIHLARQSL